MNDQTEIETGTALAIPEPASLQVMFQKPDQIAAMIERIEAEARAQAPDVTTARGRKAIASLAYKIAQSKTALDKAGKDLNADLRDKINVVDVERRKIRDRFDALKDEIRKPLDEWEAAEEARVDALKARLDRLRTAHATLADDATSDHIAALLSRVEVVAIDDTWSEFVADAARYKDQAIATLRDMRDRAQKRESEAAELARLRAEAAAREEAERQRIAAEQAEQARIAAEKAEAERTARIEREKQEAAARAAKEAEDRAKAEAARIQREAEERAEAERRAAAEREAALQRQLADAKAREEAAAQAERDRLTAERKAEADARAKRAADQAHRARIQSEIAVALEAYEGMGAMGIADAIIGGAIPHVRAVL